MKNIFQFLIKNPIITIALIISVTVLSNLTLINKTIILSNIDSTKASIVSIKEETNTQNITYTKSINELKAEIAKIEKQQDKFNTLKNTELAKQEKILADNIAKLDILSLK